MHLPPPVHGAAMVGSFIKNSSVINNEFNAEYINLATNTKLNESGKGSFKKVIIFCKLIAKIVYSVTTKRFDICHVTLAASGFGFIKDCAIVALLKLSGNKIIYHFHNKGVADQSSSRFYNSLYKFVFKSTKSILLSPYLYPDIKQYVKESDVYYCPNGIPPIENAEFIQKTKLVNNESKACIFLFLSNMMYQKGVYVLLDAAKYLKERNLKFECHFVGAWSDITESDFNQKAKEHGLSDLVYAHGPKYGADKYLFFDKADVFIFPTFYHFEAFPIVNLEAMQYGLPIISTLEGGIPDMILDGKTGFVIPQKNSIELADKLELLIYHPKLRKEMGREGKKRFESFFTLNHFENKLINILKDAVLKK